MHRLLPPRLSASLLASIAAMVCVGWTPARGDDNAAGRERWSLRVNGGDIYRGTVGPASSHGGLGWVSPSFAKPLEFPWEGVLTVERQGASLQPAADDAADPPKWFAVEQHSGITLSGEILSIDSDELTMRTMGMGQATLKISDIKHILRLVSHSAKPVQLLNAEDWEQVLPAPRNGKATKWFLKAGEISTDTSGTTISQWANIPSLATIDIDVAWEQPTVNWWLTIGEPRRMELQVRKLQNKKLLNITLLVENSRDADVASVQIPYPSEPNIALRLMCDANKGAYVLMMNDEVLGRIKGNPAERIIGRNKFSFTNTALGVLTLRGLRISDRPFAITEATVDLAPGIAEVMTRERGTFVGSIQRADVPDRLQVLSSNGTLTSISLDEVERIEFPKRAVDPNGPSPIDLLRVELTNGLRFAATKVVSTASAPQATAGPDDRNAATELCLEYPSGALCIPWDQIERIARVRPGADASPKPEDRKPGAPDPQLDDRRAMRLITDDTVSTGYIDSVFVNDAGGRTLMWFPRIALEPAPLHPNADGAIDKLVSVPSEKKPSKTPTPATVRTDQKPEAQPRPSRELRPDEPSLFLVTGDCFPGKVMSSTEEQLEFESSLFERRLVPADQVRGVRVVDYQGADAIQRAARARILTLPRMQRKNPPTHLVIARDGDVVRGRLLAFDRDEIRIEVRGEEQQLPMKNIAEIIWLEAAPKLQSPGESKPDGVAADASTQATPATTGVYQILLEQGSRVSIVPERVTQDELIGEHPTLGTCSLPWEKISRMVLGSAIRADASRNRFGKWKLQNAPDPKFVSEGTSEQNDAPTDTAQDRLIGKPAPEVDLLKLDGTPFRIEDYRGKVLILDFWASWCGPCIQSMPRIHQISREYTDAGVEAVFVNLEETEEPIRKMLERLAIVPTVALDVDGSFSKQYAVQAIPQTVVIDRDGNIVKIFVGAGDNTETELVRILDDLTTN